MNPETIKKLHDGWQLFKNYHGRGIMLDVRGEKPWDHYSFVFYRNYMEGTVRITIHGEYWDSTDRLRGVRFDEEPGEFFRRNHSEGAKILEALGITGDVFRDFIELGFKIAN